MRHGKMKKWPGILSRLADAVSASASVVALLSGNGCGKSTFYYEDKR